MLGENTHIGNLHSRPKKYVIKYLNGWSPAAPKKGCLGMLALLLMAGGVTLLGLMKLF